MPQVDAELVTALKQAKTKPMFFAFVAKNPNEGKLMVSKKKIQAQEIAQAKKELGGGLIYKGRCQNDESGQLVFELPKDPPTTLAKTLKTVISHEAGLTLKVDARKALDLTDEDDHDGDKADATPPTKATGASDNAAAKTAGDKTAAPAVDQIAVRNRLAALAAQYKQAAVGDGPEAQRLHTLFNAIKAFIEKHDYAHANNGLDMMERLLAQGPHVSAAPAAPPQGKGGSAAPPPQKGKASKPKSGPLTHEAVEMLLQNLTYLAGDSFLKGKYSPKPLQTANEPAVDYLLGQAAEVVSKWNDPKTLQEAHLIWGTIKPRLKALIKEAEGPKLGFNPQHLKPAEDAITNISKALTERDARFKMDDAAQAFQAPDVSEALELRKAQQFGPILDLIRKSNSMMAKAAKGTNFGNLAKVVDIYFKVDSMKAKLEAFKDAGLLKKTQTAADFTAFLGGIVQEAMKNYTEALLKAAEELGDEVLKNQLKGQLKKRLGMLKGMKIGLSTYNFIKSTIALAEAIEGGDPHEIAEAARDFGIATGDLLEDAGVIAEGGGTLITGIAVTVWATAEAVMMGAETAHWFRQQRALDALKLFLAQGKKVIPYGKDMVAVHNLAVEAQSSQEDSGEAEIFEKRADQMAAEVVKGLTALASHVAAHDLDSLGGYPVLVTALGPARQLLNNISSGTYPNDPGNLADAFVTILDGIKAMVAAGDKEYGE